MSEGPYVAVVGGMNMDIQGKSFRPFKAGDSNPGSLGMVPGGVGRNIAENLARLGARVELVSVLGDDDFSSRLEESCLAAGIGLAGTLRLRDSPASRYLCLLDSDGRLVGAVAAMEAMERLTPERLAEGAALLDSADIIIIDANIPEPSIAWLAARYPKARGKPLLGFDPVSARKAARGKAYLSSFAFAKPNLAEAALLAGFDEGQGEAKDDRFARAIAMASALRARGLGEAYVSMGAGGMLVEGEGPEGAELWAARLPSPLPLGLEPVSASGAGDAACAAIAWGILSGRGLGERCALALAAALLAAASPRPVNPEMSASLLSEAAKGIERERVS